MVEGAFMALIMCLLWNLMVYCAGMYLAKLESVYVAKYSVFWYAAHDCGKAPMSGIGMPPKYDTSIFQPVVTLNPDSGTDVDNQNTGGNNCPSNGGASGAGTADCGQVQSSGFSKQSFFSKGHVDTQFTWSWQRPPWWSTALSGTGKVGSDSYVMCNEGPYGIKAWDFMINVIGQAVSSAKSGS